MSSSKTTPFDGAERTRLWRLNNLKHTLTSMMRSVPPCMMERDPTEKIYQEGLEIHHDGKAGKINSCESNRLAQYPPSNEKKVANQDCQNAKKSTHVNNYLLHTLSSPCKIKYRDFATATERELARYFPGPNESNQDDQWRHELIPMKGLTFPEVLFGVLADPSQELQQIVSWMPHGRSFRILKKKKFEVLVLAVFFQCGNLKDFFKKLRAWGFQRIDSGQDNGAYYSELFLRGKPHLLKYMRRRRAEGHVENGGNPNFYLMLSQQFLKPLPAACASFSNGPVAPRDASEPSSSLLPAAIFPRMVDIGQTSERAWDTYAGLKPVPWTEKQSLCCPPNRSPIVRDPVTNDTELMAMTMYIAPRHPLQFMGGDRRASLMSNPMTMEQAMMAPRVCNPNPRMQMTDESIDAWINKPLENPAKTRRFHNPAVRQREFLTMTSPQTLLRSNKEMQLKSMATSSVAQCQALANTTDEDTSFSMQTETHSVGSIGEFAPKRRLSPVAGKVAKETVNQDTMIEPMYPNRIDTILEAENEREARKMSANNCSLGDLDRFTSFGMQDQRLNGNASVAGLSHFMGFKDLTVSCILSGAANHPLGDIWSPTMGDMSFEEMEKVDVAYMRYCMGDPRRLAEAWNSHP